jgi:hypothetical protein
MAIALARSLNSKKGGSGGQRSAVTDEPEIIHGVMLSGVVLPLRSELANGPCRNPFASVTTKTRRQTTQPGHCRVVVSVGRFPAAAGEIGPRRQVQLTEAAER